MARRSGKINYETDITEFAEFIRNLKEKARDLAIEAMQESALEGVSDIVNRIKKAKLVDTGALAQSVMATPTKTGAAIDITAPYAGVMEYGRRPGAAMPPLDAIYAWVVRKGLATEDPDEEDGEGEAWDIARAIQLSIARSGIEPRRFMARAMKKIRKESRDRIIERLKELTP